MFELTLAIFMLIGGLGLIVFCSIIAVKHSAILAAALGISPLVIGITLVSIGTDISEIFNSIISCALGHGDNDVGDSMDSDLTQLTLIFGILPLVSGVFYVHRKDIIILGACEVDSTLSIGIGQVLFPQKVTASLAVPTVLYTLFASFIVITIIAVRKKVDRRAGVVFIFLYFLSYIFLFSFWITF